MMAWLPTFFLYFNLGMDIKEVILLESIYYLAVVVLEVPSGYFSDSMGRKKTLVISSICFSASYLMFGLFSPEFTVFAFAQVLLALGFSFMSGTDTSFYYESLNEVGIEDQFGVREAKIQAYTRYAGAIAALIGGFLGSINLSYSYLVSFLFMMPAILITLRFKEPKTHGDKNRLSFINQLKTIAQYLKTKELKWLFMITVVIYVLVHVPYEFYQPYLKLLEGEFDVGMDAAIYSGILFAATRFIGALIAGRSVIWTARFGLKAMFVIALLVQLFLIGIFSLVLHPMIIILILGRSVSMSLTSAPINAEIAPRINANQRATYFSVQSLVCRLSFSITLILLSLPLSSGIVNDWPTLSYIFKYSFLIGAILCIPLLLLESGTLFKKSASTV